MRNCRVATPVWLALVLQGCSAGSPSPRTEQQPAATSASDPLGQSSTKPQGAGHASVAGTSSSSPTQSGEPLLVSHSAVEQMLTGLGGSIVTVVVTEAGKVNLELLRWNGNGTMPEPIVRTCTPLSFEEASALRRLIGQAQDAVDSSSYSTSTAPPPSADYSRSETYTFAPAMRWREVTVGGWADHPEALRALGRELGRLEDACPR
jgi:hypothetical protein